MSPSRTRKKNLCKNTSPRPPKCNTPRKQRELFQQEADAPHLYHPRLTDPTVGDLFQNQSRAALLTALRPYPKLRIARNRKVFCCSLKMVFASVIVGGGAYYFQVTAVLAAPQPFLECSALSRQMNASCWF